MKNLFTRTIVLLMVIMWNSISSDTYAQDCHTPSPDTTDYKQIPWYGDESNYTVLDRMYDSLYNLYAPSGGPQYRGYEEGIILRVPLKFWIYQEALGVAGVGNDDLPDERRLQFAVDRLNDAFRGNNLAFRFFILEVEPIVNANAVDMNAGERTVLSTANKHPTALNVHVPNDGGDRYEPWNNAVFINRSRFAETNNSTLTHEIGHYFGLLHTHEFHWLALFSRACWQRA